MPEHDGTPRGIHAVNLKKSYRQGDRHVDALRGCTLRIDEPGFYAIMGPSGSGKTTLLHMLAAIDRPDSGEVRIGGDSLGELNDAALTRFRRRRIGIVFQQFNLLPTMTALENASLPGLLDGMPARARTERARHLLERLGLGDRLLHAPDALSGGEQQRVAIARALFFRPPVILADEPTGALDSHTSQELWSLLRELAAEERTIVLMVTHEPAAAINCRRVFLLRDGEVSDTFDVDGMDPAGLAARAHHAGRPA